MKRQARAACAIGGEGDGGGGLGEGGGGDGAAGEAAPLAHDAVDGAGLRVARDLLGNDSSADFEVGAMQTSQRCKGLDGWLFVVFQIAFQWCKRL